MNPGKAPSEHQIGEWLFDGSRLKNKGVTASLKPNDIKALALLCSKRGEFVTHNDLIVAIWGEGIRGKCPTDVSSVICRLRAALGDGHIETKNSVGYMLQSEADLPEPSAPTSLVSPASSELPRSHHWLGFVRRPKRRTVTVLAGVVVCMVAVFVWQKLHSSNGPSFKLNSANRTETFLPVAYLPAIQYGQDIAGRQVSAWMPADAFINEPQFKARFSEIHKAGILAVAWHLFADGRALGSDGTSLTPGFLKSYDEAMNIATQTALASFGSLWIGCFWREVRRATHNSRCMRTWS